MLQSTWDVDHLEVWKSWSHWYRLLQQQTFRTSSPRFCMLSRKLYFRRKKMFICLQSLRPPQVMELLSPPSNFNHVWTSDWHQFSPQVWQLEIHFWQKSAMDPRTLSQIPNHKSSPMLRGYDLDTREEIQPVPSQSSHSCSATPASHHTQMRKCYFVASWLTASIALEKVLVPVTKPTGSTVLGVSQVSAQENNIPHWQAPGKSLAHTRVCFVCSDYLRSRHFLHRQEPGTFQSRASEPARL